MLNALDDAQMLVASMQRLGRAETLYDLGRVGMGRPRPLLGAEDPKGPDALH